MVGGHRIGHVRVGGDGEVLLQERDVQGLVIEDM
jgi:hypothetical protein